VLAAIGDPWGEEAPREPRGGACDEVQPPLSALHREWAELSGRIERLEMEISEREPAQDDLIVYAEGRFNTEAQIDAWAEDALAKAAASDTPEQREKIRVRVMQALAEYDYAASIEEKRARLKAALADAAAARSRKIEKTGPVDRLAAELDELAYARDDVLRAIDSRPITTFEDIAVALDIAMGHGEIDPPDDLADDWIATCRLLAALRRQAPQIEFTALRRAYPTSVDVDAIIAGTNG
jgi:hypothetical protein